MNPHSDQIADLLDRVATLDDAPDRRRHEWFYVDLAQLMTDTIEDAVIRVAADEPELLHQPSYDQGHHDGYHSGHADGYEQGIKVGRASTGHDQDRRADAWTTTGRDGSARRSGNGAAAGGDHRSGETRIVTPDLTRHHRVHRRDGRGGVA